MLRLLDWLGITLSESEGEWVIKQASSHAENASCSQRPQLASRSSPGQD